LALAARLLDVGFFRIGSEDYAERNESYGLTTMLREHVTVGSREVVFDFPAKSGQRRVQAIADPEALALLGALKRRRTGAQLLAYCAEGDWRELTADEVNAYLKRCSGGDFTAKDFRTWNATVLMAQALAVSGGLAGPRERQRAVVRAVQEVARYLGNTPAVARASYIDPRVVDLYLDGITVDVNVIDRTVRAPGLAIHGPLEAAVLRMLRDPQKRGAGKA
jgi:DNA topoisomerase IB